MDYDNDAIAKKVDLLKKKNTFRMRDENKIPYKTKYSEEKDPSNANPPPKKP